jgi:hypothetical protein
METVIDNVDNCSEVASSCVWIYFGIVPCRGRKDVATSAADNE